MAHQRIRIFNKHILNRILGVRAGASYSPFAAIRHVGRRSGASYETPIIVEPLDKGVVIALTYGPQVDWYRNVLAAGQATLRWHGRTYTLTRPQPIEQASALSAFPLPARLILRLLGTEHFVRFASE